MKSIRPSSKFAALLMVGLTLASCAGQSSTAPLHSGRIPFRWTESPPKAECAAFTEIARYAPGKPEAVEVIALVRPGDLICFHMSHAEAQGYLKQGTIQKIPYELFRYGHLALVTPGIAGEHWNLLQIALGQAANAKDDQAYLTDKSWLLFRPQAGRVDLAKLAEFTRITTGQDDLPAAKYDFTAVLGLYNKGLRPNTRSDIAKSFSCATLVIAAYHYAGYPLQAVHRHGVLDLVTPRQVVEAGPGPQYIKSGPSCIQR